MEIQNDWTLALTKILDIMVTAEQTKQISKSDYKALTTLTEGNRNSFLILLVTNFFARFPNPDIIKTSLHTSFLPINTTLSESEIKQFPD